MPAQSLLPPEVWEALKLANIRGVSDEDLARQFEVTEIAIRKRRSRDEVWQAAVSDRTHHSVVKQKLANVTDKALSRRDVPNVTKPDSGLISASVGDVLRRNGERATLRAQQIALASLDKAPDSLPVQFLSDVKTAMAIARIAGGQDKEGGEVRVNVAMFTDGMAGTVREDEVTWGEPSEAETIGENEGYSTEGEA